MSSIGLKLGSLLMRTVSKPIANTLKAQAKEHESFRKICIGLAQGLHKFDIRLRMGLMGSEHASKVRPLNETKAIDNGATFLSESFIFGVAGGLILYESWRQRQKELNRRETVADDIRTLQYEIDYIKSKLKEYNVRLDDYVPPRNYNPLVLKVGEDDIKVIETVEELKAKVEALDKRVLPATVAHPPSDVGAVKDDETKRKT